MSFTIAPNRITGDATTRVEFAVTGLSTGANVSISNTECHDPPGGFGLPRTAGTTGADGAYSATVDVAVDGHPGSDRRCEVVAHYDTGPATDPDHAHEKVFADLTIIGQSDPDPDPDPDPGPVPALPVIAQLLLAALLAVGASRRYLRR